MGPLVKVAGAKIKWIASVGEFTVAGLITSVLVGAILGAAGSLLVPDNAAMTWLVIAVVALGLLARQLGWFQLPLPQIGRQTAEVWVKRYPRWLAVGLWGLDIGIAFTTWQSYTGAWLLGAATVFVRDPIGGATIFACYWIGRVLPVWLAPALLPDALHTPQAMNAIAAQEPLFARLHMVGLGLGLATASFVLASHAARL